ncbi:alpha/beta fold hydrolase [Mycolicibacterium arseniciresistens]|uniref:Alpha/beta hydrolase n=1 Tax=Mycolicibacterium arseniciresistens TaxID=3062257 RepID=A0ABT8UNK8_9MYCO|nr:alpha/beta hydrolase [Mycolicibacterium arseniciresistens]MDO3639376.1 alpha/beta hydrolase [Mycolicibacterium arseniciresistens]
MPALTTLLRVPSGPVEIAVHATGEPDGRRPVAVLLHGTGYVAQVWADVVPHLARTHTVLSIDRRGHGMSGQSAGGYEFSDFADDLCAVVDALGIQDALGVGHSAGATDLLLAAARRPGAFSRLFTVEPTAMVPREGVLEQELGKLPRAVVVKVQRRRNAFPSRQEALGHLSRTAGFAGWQDGGLRAFGDFGLVERDGAVYLRCHPESEAAMLRPIFHVMEQSYTRSEVFAPLRELRMPVCVASCANSEPVYAPMAAAARELIPAARHLTFPTGHCVAQQDPDLFASAVLDFAATRST